WGGGGYSQSLYDAIAAAGAADSLFIAAAGNSNVNTDASPHYPSAYNLDNIISVASTTSTDGRSSFSNYGANTVDLGAPGSSIYSTVPGGGYAFFSGTSMATPHVAGAASLLWAYDPTLTSAEVKQAILDTADPLSALSGITVTGGRLNVYDALIAAQSGGGGGGGQTPPPGDPGRDVLSDGDGGIDTLNLAAVTGGSSIDLTPGSTGTIGGASFTLASDALIENFIGGDGVDLVTGNDQSNSLYGGRGGDTISGGVGDDVLRGGGGADLLTGGSGADLFVFGEGDSGAGQGSRDLVTDFAPGADLLDLSGIDGDGLQGSYDGFWFVGTDTFGGAGSLRYVFDAS
ncbi:MAG: S8 family serine peptidase, partial [bacterium]|nr:S8 family serine peptidase [bacterium]